jgi:hypothetical protein
MSIYVKDSGSWSLAGNVYVNNGGSWIEPQEVYVNNSGTWTLLHKVLRITSNQTNANLFSLSGSPTTSLRLIAIVSPGVTINSATTSTPSLSIGAFPSGSQIKLVNYGVIKGTGGNGGTGADYGGSATAGGAGGTALAVGSAVTIENNGTIAGGGGGAGGGGYYSTSSSCFPAGTPISTPNGIVAIEALNVGDLVYGFDIGETANYSADLIAKPVTQVFKHSWAESDEFSRLIIIDHSSGTLTITGNHEVLTSSRDATGPYPHFVRAEHLQIGDIIYDDQGQPSEILEITPGKPYDYVYNFEVADVHTYVAGGIRVHNGGGGGGGKGTTYYYYAGYGGAAGTGDVAGSAGANGSAANGVDGAAGTAGGLGQAGTAGAQTNAGAGGAAGYYITGNTSVTWTATGTLLGSTS